MIPWNQGRADSVCAIIRWPLLFGELGWGCEGWIVVYDEHKSFLRDAQSGAGCSAALHCDIDSTS
jgi:hypothetical protein